MSRQRLLIPIAMQFSVRYLLRTGLLERIREYAQPVILLGWDDSDLVREFTEAGCEVHRLPPALRGKKYDRVRNQINAWHQERLASPSTEIDERRSRLQLPLKTRLWRQASQRIFQLQAKAIGGQELQARERKLFWEDTKARELSAWVKSLRPDAAFSLTPYLPDEEIVLRICAELDLPLCAAILSFDNITTRGWIPVTFDHYLLWNSYNEVELRRAYTEASDRPVTIVGPPQFDFYWNQNYLWSNSLWRERLRIPKDRPVILYGAGYTGIVPHEPYLVEQIDRAIEAKEIPDDPIILLRRHPVDPVERWLPTLGRSKHILYDDPWPTPRKILGRTNIRQENIERLASSLMHSQVHISVSSTMTVDGAIFDRPQIGPAYDDSPGRKYDKVCYELYLREHYLPITDSGGLDFIRSREEMISAVRSALIGPDRLKEGRKRIVREICTYDDGRCTERVDDALRVFLAVSPRAAKAKSHLSVV